MLRIALAALLMLPIMAFAENTDWLVGDWLHATSDRDSQEILTFKKDGMLLSTKVVSGEKIRGIYRIKNNFISATLIDKGRPQTLKLTYDNTKSKLFFKSSPSNTLHYDKMPDNP